MTDIRSIHSVEFEGFYYVESTNGLFGKGCSRCGGTGHYSFNGVDSICYKCGNVWEERMGDLFDTREQAEKWCHQRAVRKVQADRKREAERLAKVAKLEAKVAAIPEDVRTFLLAVELGNGYAWEYETEETYENAKAAGLIPAEEKDMFVRSMAEQVQHVVNYDRPFTDRMVEAVRKVIARRAERKVEADAHPAPEGRVAVTGEIVSTKVQESDFGYTYKVLVKDDAGYKVWVSLPTAQRESAHGDFYDWVQERGSYLGDFGPDCWFLGLQDNSFPGVKGRRITFTATLTPSRDDVAFAFGSRPTKGAWL